MSVNRSVLRLPPTSFLFVVACVLIVAVAAFPIFHFYFVPVIIALTILGAIAAVKQPLGALAFIALYLPFEPFLLKFVSDDVYVFAKYLPELLMYFLGAVLCWRMVARKEKFASTPLDFPFILFLVVLIASALINAVPPTIALLGIRQIIRFILVFFIAYHLHPPTVFIRRLTVALFAVVLFQASLGLMQKATGGLLDAYLLPSASRTLGDITLTAGTSEFWDPGSRIFGTLGRYDRLGNLLAFFLALCVPLVYEPRLRAGRRAWCLVLLLGLPALIFTFSRASWFAFLLAFLFVAIVLRRDRRVAIAFGSAAILLAFYVGISGLRVGFITEAPGQTLVERFYETFSYARWRGEYYGLGRLFWMVQTPSVVVPAAPLFGHGPGQFGGGAAAALGRTVVYDRLGLPFGVYGTDGYIDNNWFSLWGETGTLGIILFLSMGILLFRAGMRLYREGEYPFARAIGAGYAGALLGAALIGFLSTAFEIRTFGFYLWMYGAFVVKMNVKRPHARKAFRAGEMP